MKKVFCLLIVFSLLFVLCSCSSGVKLSSNDDVETIKYKNNLYSNYQYDPSWYMESEDYVTQVGWTFWFPWYSAFYADEKENPTFIYCSRTDQCYFREGIDYMDVELVLRNDENKNFTFSEIASGNVEKIDDSTRNHNGGRKWCRAYMNDCPSMETDFEIVKIDDKYFVILQGRYLICLGYPLNEEYLDFFGVNF